MAIIFAYHRYWVLSGLILCTIQSNLYDRYYLLQNHIQELPKNEHVQFEKTTPNFHALCVKMCSMCSMFNVFNHKTSTTFGNLSVVTSRLARNCELRSIYTREVTNLLSEFGNFVKIEFSRTLDKFTALFISFIYFLDFLFHFLAT